MRSSSTENASSQQNLYHKLPTKYSTYEVKVVENESSLQDYKIVEQLTFGEDSDVTTTESSHDTSHDDSQLSSSSLTSYSSCEMLI